MRTTALSHVHEALGARMVPFGGYRMPVSYVSIRDEHRHVRKAAGLFDLMHMARFYVRGEGRNALLERVCSNRMKNLKPGEARYTLFCNEEGGVLDDIIVYRFEAEDLVVGNASNRDRDFQWLCEVNEREGLGAEIEDRSDQVCMLAIQGPLSEATLRGVTKGTPEPLGDLGYYAVMKGEVLGVPTALARTGYTGEDGFELYFDAEHAEAIWNGLIEFAGADLLRPIGLGARDTLRLEAGMPLYGHELSETINPLEAGLSFAVKLKGRSFIGRDALARIKKEKPARKLCCIMGDGKRIPREGCEVKIDGKVVGTVTSGTFSPTFERPIAMALIEREAYEMGRNAVIDVRGKPLAAWITKRPFYKRRES
ncbi:MAG: glycine cleavage system aminomethyltransferase GcvT [Planctomycetota bacterium]